MPNKPILLTEELLLKLGFDKNIRVSYSTGKAVEYNVFSLGMFLFNEIQGLWYYGSERIKNIEFVHEAQNVYFALMNKELTIKI